MTSALRFEKASRWYGDVVALSDLEVAFPSGITGLLGANGAGKSTTLSLAAGLIRPSRGTVRVHDADPRTTPSVFRRVGLSPAEDGLFEHLTAHGHVAAIAELQGVTDPGAAADRALDMVDLQFARDRKVRGFSKGMRQGVKLAGALAHDPDLLLLDEPLNGLDPARRRHIVELVRRLGAEGRTVIVSSHVLSEVERMAPRVVVLVNGRLVAEGDTAELRTLLAERPRIVRVDAGAGTVALAQAVLGDGIAGAVRLDERGATFETADADRFARRLPSLAQAARVTLRSVEPAGDDLASVYGYLEARARGGVS